MALIRRVRDDLTGVRRDFVSTAEAALAFNVIATSCDINLSQRFGILPEYANNGATAHQSERTRQLSLAVRGGRVLSSAVVGAILHKLDGFKQESIEAFMLVMGLGLGGRGALRALRLRRSVARYAGIAATYLEHDNVSCGITNEIRSSGNMAALNDDRSIPKERVEQLRDYARSAAAEMATHLGRLSDQLHGDALFGKLDMTDPMRTVLDAVMIAERATFHLPARGSSSSPLTIGA